MNGCCNIIANELLHFANARGLTIITAESCSAGACAKLLASGDGASTAFLGGIVAYTKDAKTKLLGVPPELLARKTAVCAEVAEAMALGAVCKGGASLGVSFTGVAGPEPDEDGNPVGLVYCGAGRSDGSALHRRLDLNGSPDEIISQACLEGLSLLRSFALS